MTREITEKKLEIVQREIRELESKLLSVEVNLRKQKELRWELLGLLESKDTDDETFQRNRRKFGTRTAVEILERGIREQKEADE